jgi:circadian clock protein KaiC
MLKSDINLETLSPRLEKTPTGIKGFDQIVNGGLPKGRVSLVAGGPGCGKTLMAMEFLVRGAQEFGEPGVFLAFEETEIELKQNFISLGEDLDKLEKADLLIVDYVRVERSEILETGEYNLDGLFIRLQSDIDSIGAKRIVLDTIESLFASFSQEAILRAELRRLFRWLKDKGITAIITGESTQEFLTRHGLQEFVSDCVIILDHRVKDQIATRYLRVVKYRGSRHATDEYPFLIGDNGLWVFPISSLGLDYGVSEEHISSGVERLDAMLEGKGYYRGSSVLVSGTAGSGKTSLSAHFVDAACKRGERALYFAFEEPVSQIVRNMRSIGIDLQPWIDQGLLRFRAVRPTSFGLEMHLLTMQHMVEEFKPSVVVIDPITNLMSHSEGDVVKSMLMRLIDYLKMAHVTTLFNSLTAGGENEASTDMGISSLMDAWLLVRNLETSGERTRGLNILKVRGMNHSKQVREFRLTDHGVDLVDVYISPEGVFSGSARLAREGLDRIALQAREAENENRRRLLEQKKMEVAAQIAVLQAQIKAEEQAFELETRLEKEREKILLYNVSKIAQARGAEVEKE